ncbi:MarR family winged helix-turn-helix transcriptional regulator [Streptomyces sp. NRRL F-5123]|uniref:MarR family winged helix-turn-helix transcriptional regulator n=1 Tax=Streptomyces sp. NRRL F-5123 TaxID=1463856 RepID=UPI0004E1B860|nr:MarR family transcriptional regulator [Streptomyces sp. NRRL F-5123]
MSTTAAELHGRLGHLLKHAQARLAALNAEALAPFGISGRELAVLLVLAGQEAPSSQQRAAARLGVDRTTMVTFLDTLEGKGLLARRPDPADRRRNVVVLTEQGTDTLRRATAASDEAERRFLAPLTAADATGFRTALKDVALYDGPA